MSLYREVSRRRRLPLLAAAAALLVGIAAGFVVGRSTAPEPSVANALEKIAVDLDTARDALELVAIEYPQGVSGGRVTAPTEYDAANADLERSREAFERAQSGLGPLAVEDAAEVERMLVELAALVERKAPAPAVEAKARATERALRALPGGS